MAASGEVGPALGIAPVPMQDEERRHLSRFAGLDRPAAEQGLWRRVLRPWLSLVPATLLLAWLAQRAALLPGWLEGRLGAVLAAYLGASGLGLLGYWLWLRGEVCRARYARDARVRPGPGSSPLPASACARSQMFQSTCAPAARASMPATATADRPVPKAPSRSAAAIVGIFRATMSHAVRPAPAFA